jgi:hypothetical protein
MTTQIRRVAVIGTGVIGASWTALFLAKGLKVVATDVAPGAEGRLKQYVDEAWPALESLGLAPGASRSNLKFVADLSQAVAGAELVQENGPERIDFKKALYGQLDALLPPTAIIASSSSGLTMSEIQSGCPTHPERCVIGHPFNPPHLIPLVEIVGGAKTSEDTIRRATDFYTALGKRTIRLHKEVPGHVANRLQAALARNRASHFGGRRECRRRRHRGVLGPRPSLGRHGSNLIIPPRRRSGRHRALLRSIYGTDDGMVESPWQSADHSRVTQDGSRGCSQGSRHSFVGRVGVAAG